MKRLVSLLTITLLQTSMFSVDEMQVEKTTLDSSIEQTTPNYQVSNDVTMDDIMSPSSDAAKHLASKPEKSAFVTMLLSGLYPGLGHLYLGDMRTAGELAGSTTVGLGITALGKNSHELSMTGSETYLVSWGYGMYSSYRDLRKYNGISNYSYQMPDESFKELALAPFQISVLKKPEVWGGILGGLAIGSAIEYLAFHNGGARISCNAAFRINPAFAFPTGIWEEAYFRGFIQSALSDNYNPTVGMVGSSLLFGIAHYPNSYGLENSADRRKYRTVILPYLTAYGSYFSYLTYKNHSLKEAIAVHAWYDFILFLGNYLESGSISESVPSFQITFSF